MMSLKDSDYEQFPVAMLFTAGLKARLLTKEVSCVQFCIIGKTETRVEKLQSILVQLEYAHQIHRFSSNGIPFNKHLYVPEIHPITKVEFCEREDEAHVFKVCVYILF